jgi:hypothetical protein
VGGHRPTVWGGELSDKNIYIIKYTAALHGCRSIIIKVTTNQKLAAATEGSMEGIFHKQDAWGTCDSIVLVAIRCK